MAEERKRIKRAEVSDETRAGRHRAAVNPYARKDAGKSAREADAIPGASRSAAGRGGAR